MVKHGKTLGLDIVEVNAKNFISHLDDINTDNFYIINNFPLLYLKYPNQINEILETKRYARYVHDYDWVYGTIPEEIIRQVFKDSKLNIFLSPLHYKRTKMTGLPIDNHIVIPSPIQFDLPTYIERKEDTVIYTGGIATHKGITNLMNYALLNPHLSFHLYGWVENQSLLECLPKNVKIFKPIAQDKIQQKLYEYEYFIHLPLWNEPFGRSVAEAYFAGCELITNNKVGFQSFDWNYQKKMSVKKEIDEAPTKFWNAITNLL